jgi:hypothetical protein
MQNPQSSISHLTPVTSLDEVYQTLKPDPLTTKAELTAFYRSEMNEVRGDMVQRMQLQLDRSHNIGYFKAFFMGHQGIGKSTELSRLTEQVQTKFNPIRFSAMSTLDPSNFQPLDVLLMMMVKVAEQTSLPIDQGGAGQQPPEARLNEIWDWFATEKDTRDRATASAINIEAGSGIKADSLWGKVSGLFATLKGEVKFTSNRKQEVVAYRISRLDLLIKLANRLLDDCNDLLRKANGKEWLFIGEDFDKAGIPIARLEDLFITYANIFKDLRSHLIFNLPITLYYSSKAPRLPFTEDRCFILPDTPIFNRDKSPNLPGREALAAVLKARMNPDLFANNQMMRSIIASGGNLRDLFVLVNYAADTATLRGANQIEANDVEKAILNLRGDYERRLGQSPFDLDKVTFADKSDRLIQIYAGNPDAQITDEVMYSLLGARAVQEFNSTRWFGVHPLVVDILIKQNKLQPDANGKFLGGIE